MEANQMKYLSNGFSPKMLNPNKTLTFTLKETTYEEIMKNKNELVNSIGHQIIADHLDIEKNRINIQLEEGDIIYIVDNEKEDHTQFNYRKITINQ
ncbi:MAG: DUF1874 domain-containing protein [Methanosphaera stadtmanae]|nr:DUF1874 domain-containing protein [Methanosphaera stadtmanae]